MLRQIFTGDLQWTQMSALLLGVMVVGGFTQFMDGDRMERAWNRFSGWHPVVQGVSAAVLLVAILALGPEGVSPFIYFQF